jgi:hypothetical protein
MYRPIFFCDFVILPFFLCFFFVFENIWQHQGKPDQTKSGGGHDHQTPPDQHKEPGYRPAAYEANAKKHPKKGAKAGDASNMAGACPPPLPIQATV